jgi:hypothetical protein
VGAGEALLAAVRALAESERFLMYVYSGKCRLCETGVKTPFADVMGNTLFTGDIVIVATDDCPMPSGLTVVVSDQYQSYSDGSHVEHVEKEDGHEFFVMGIKSVDLYAPGQWHVIRLKEHSDIVNGEHWQAYGFRYSED